MLEAAEALEIAALDALVHINVNKQPHLSKRAKTPGFHLF